MLINLLPKDCINYIASFLLPIEFLRLTFCSKQFSFLIEYNIDKLNKFKKTHPVIISDFYDKIYAWYQLFRRSNFYSLVFTEWIKEYILLFSKKSELHRLFI